MTDIVLAARRSGSCPTCGKRYDSQPRQQFCSGCMGSACGGTFRACQRPMGHPGSCADVHGYFTPERERES